MRNPKSPYREDPAPKPATSHSGRGPKHKSLGNTKTNFYKPGVPKYYFGGDYKSLNNLDDYPGRPTMGNMREGSIDDIPTPSDNDQQKISFGNDKSEVTFDGNCKKNRFNELYLNKTYRLSQKDTDR